MPPKRNEIRLRQLGAACMLRRHEQTRPRPGINLCICLNLQASNHQPKFRPFRAQTGQHSAAMGVSVRPATVEDLLGMQRCNLLCLPENYQLKVSLRSDCMYWCMQTIFAHVPVSTRNAKC